MEISGIQIPDPLSENAIETYRWAVVHGELAMEEAAEELGFSPDGLRMAISELERRGLLRPAPASEGGTRLVTVAPDTAAAGTVTPMETLLRDRLDHILRLRGEFDLLRPLYAESQARQQARTPLTEVVELSTVLDLIDDAMASCRHQVLVCEPSREQPAELVERTHVRDLAMLRRGVEIRTLYQHSTRRHTVTQQYIDKLVEAGAHVRTLTELFGRMIAFDRSTAFIPHRTEPDGAVIVRDPSVVEYLCSTFDHAWMLATPYQPGQHRTYTLGDEAKQAIARMLTEGMKDEVIARRLGISLRTCRKHIAEIMEHFSAESRFQLGYLIRARLGEPGKGPDLDRVISETCSSPS
ncbi:LuxR C-terminal-related transcriptional regulator [Streptomyces virginiae]